MSGCHEGGFGEARFFHDRVELHQRRQQFAHAIERPRVRPVGQRLGGVGMRFHEHAGHARRDRRAREHRNEFALSTELVPCPPGNCTECVASKTTGQPVVRMIASERMSDTRL